MAMRQKIQRLCERLRVDGLGATSAYTVGLFFKKISPNYGLNPARARALSPIGFFMFIARDSIDAFVDLCIMHIGNRLTRRAEIPTQFLAPFSLYFLNGRGITRDSIIYSFGVGKNIDFDRAVSQKYGCTVFLFDPTPPAIRFMETCMLGELLHFMPIGLWTETTTMKFYFDRNSAGSGNLSLMNLFQTSEYVEAKCMTLADILRSLNHVQIDVLKVDIEGAGLPVLQSLLKGTIRPGQIVAELEPPKRVYGASFAAIFHFYRAKQNLFTTLARLGYRIHTYGKAEFLASRY